MFPMAEDQQVQALGGSVSPNTTKEEASSLYTGFISEALQRPKVKVYHNLGIGSTLTHVLMVHAMGSC